jgi:hypothetical protein
MRRPFFASTILSLVLGALSMAADLPQQWRAWRYWRAVQVQGAGSISYVALDKEVLTNSANELADLRVVDEAGAEVPYVLRLAPFPPKPEVAEQQLQTVLRENSFVPGQYTQVVIDVGARAKFHHLVRVDTPETDFINWVEVAASDDAHTWRIVKARAPISRFLKENIKGDQSVRYSENNARYLRLRIAESDHSFAVSGVSVYAVTEASPPVLAPTSLPLTLPAVPEASSDPSLTQWTVDLGTQSLPVSELEFSSEQAEFFRAVRVSSSSDGKEWQSVSGGAISRYNAGDTIEESLHIPLYDAWGPRYWRVQVLNGNDTGLTSVRLALAARSRLVVFRALPDRRYRLLYGNARASAPQYDFARTLKVSSTDPPLSARLGAEEETTNYADPRPFSERHPELLWLVLGIAVVVLGGAALRALKTPASSDT